MCQLGIMFLKCLRTGKYVLYKTWTIYHALIMREYDSREYVVIILNALNSDQSKHLYSGFIKNI